MIKNNKQKKMHVINERTKVPGSIVFTCRLLATVVAVSLLSQPTAAQISDSSRMASVEIKSFRSEILRENRTIYIQTPEKMRPTDQYPVLYLLDGESFIMMAGGQVKYLSESYKIIPSMIVVGIKSTDRFKDLTPTHTITGPDGKPDSSASSPFKTSGGGNQFLQFLREELIPYVEKNYPTAPYRILYGHSLGGLMAIHAFNKYPDLFHAFIAVSPSLQWDEHVMLKMTREKLNEKNILNKILFFSDASEGESFHIHHIALDSILKAKKIPGLKFRYSHYPDETHISVPVKAFYEGIRYIYPNWHLPYSSSAFRKTMSSAIIIKHYDELSSLYHYKVLPPLDEINTISRFLANDPNRIDDALQLLQLNARNHPQSAAVYEIMGDTYMKLKDPKHAKANYQKALALDPKSHSLKEKMANIKD